LGWVKNEMTDPAAIAGADHDRENRRMVVLTDGYSNPITAKTACCVLRYCPEEVVAIFDREASGQTAGRLLGVGGSVPVIDQLSLASEARTLLIGIAPPGGKIPAAWRPIVLEAINRGMTVVSGLHDFLCDDREFAAAAAANGVNLIDVRRNQERDVANRIGIREACLRVHTVGQDCSVGKMLVAVELTRALAARKVATKFIATGQTGIIVEGDGCPIDCVVSDFVSGAVEKLILAQQHHDILMIEGQGSLAHPRYSAVTLGLLHGCMPHGMILCYEAGRKGVNGMSHIGLKSLPELRGSYESMANLMCPSEVIGIAINTRLLSDSEAAQERDRVREQMGLPVCDVIRDGTDELVDAVLDLKRRRSQ
jgi:uncharacterized NAD-dependent epimerase/dehydratase family protein